MSSQFDQDLEFDWDPGNLDKNWLKHKVSQKESESVFRDQQSLSGSDDSHSLDETRYQLIGKSESGKTLTTIFTFRDHKIRIISSRSANKKECSLYEKNKKTLTNS